MIKERTVKTSRKYHANSYIKGLKKEFHQGINTFKRKRKALIIALKLLIRQLKLKILAVFLSKKGSRTLFKKKYQLKHF